MIIPEYYYYGLAAMIYLTTCWAFAIIRWFHTCRAPKQHRKYIWPDRKLQVLVYLISVLLIPYVKNPMDSAAWMLMKSYFPATYYFYCGMLMLCYAGTVKQWAQWKTISWLAALVVIATMLLPVLNAWLPFRLLSPEGVHFWQNVITAESLLMMAYCSIAMWQVGRWILEGRDDNYSNPDDFPIDYARRIWLMPLALTPILWPAYLLDSPAIMALEHILLAIFNILLLIIVMPIWRRTHIISSAAAEEVEVPHLIAQHDATVDEQIAQTALD